MLGALAGVLVLVLPVSASADEIVLNEQGSLHIQFKRIPPTHYAFENNTLSSRVAKSASFVLIPFKTRMTVSAVSYDWKLESGKLVLADAAQETRREGDDAVFKLGLLIEGKAALPNPLMPGWLKQANAALSFASDSMVYVVADARHAAGESWTSPYNRHIRMLAADSRPLGDGWHHARADLGMPVSVVGLWLMADGDNTGSTFVSRVKNIGLE